jgi:hypothetical protein
MLSGGAERYLVRAEASSLDDVTAALHAEAGKVASSCNRNSYSHSRRRHIQLYVRGGTTPRKIKSGYVVCHGTQKRVGALRHSQKLKAVLY